MERIRVYKVLKGLAKFFIIFGAVFTILGLSLIIKSTISGFNFRLLSGDWNSVIFLFQGILFISIGYFNLKNEKYFIEWDTHELRFFLPDRKIIETIKLSEIKSVEIRLFEIEIRMPDTVRTINLENLEFEDLRRVKKKIEEISKLEKK